nr:isoform 2 of mediator of rna polymerase ii transcription subunit 25 [Quercus suber]
MQIVRLISQDHMNNKQYVGKADFLVFRAMNQHGFLGQLQEKKKRSFVQSFNCHLRHCCYLFLTKPAA